MDCLECLTQSVDDERFKFNGEIESYMRTKAYGSCDKKYVTKKIMLPKYDYETSPYQEGATDSDVLLCFYTTVSISSIKSKTKFTSSKVASAIPMGNGAIAILGCSGGEFLEVSA